MTAVPAASPAAPGGLRRRPPYRWAAAASRGFQALAWNPVVRAELRSGMRARAGVGLTVLLGTVGAAGWLSYQHQVGASGSVLGLASAGSSTFKVMAATFFVAVAVVVPGTAGPSLTREQGTGALDLLLATPLGPARVLAGKLVPSVIWVMFLLAAALPLFSAAFLWGGVSLGEAGQLVAFLLVGAFALASLSLLAAVKTVGTPFRAVASYAVVTVFLAGPIALGYGLNAMSGAPGPQGPPPFAGAGANGIAGTVSTLSPAVGAAALLGSGDCGVVTPFFGSSIGVPTVLGCGPDDQFSVNVGPLGSWPTWEVSLALDGAVGLAAMGWGTGALRRRLMR